MKIEVGEVDVQFVTVGSAHSTRFEEILQQLDRLDRFARSQYIKIAAGRDGQAVLAA